MGLKNPFFYSLLDIIAKKLGNVMPQVKMEKECRCFQDSDFLAVQEFESIDEALDVANNMCAKMNEEFCTKHHFKAVYEDGNMKIKVEMNG